MSNPTISSNLLVQAEILFHKQGYLATSLSDLPVGRANIQKEDLLWASAIRIADAFQAALNEVLREPRPIDERLRYAMMAHIRVIVDNLAAANIYMREWQFLSPERLTIYKQRRDAYEAEFRTLIREGIYSGIFAPVDEKLVTLMVLSGLNWTSQWYRPDGDMTAEEIAQTLADLTLNGLYRRV